jgi:hypothetical protein
MPSEVKESLFEIATSLTLAGMTVERSVRNSALV